MPRLVQLSTRTARSVVLKTVKLRPGVFRKVNWNAPVGSFVGCVSENRRRHHARGVEQLGGRTGVAGVKTSDNQNLAVGKQGGDMVATAADQGQGWRPFSRGGIVQFGGGWKNAAKIADASGNQDLAARQQSGGVRLARLAHRTCGCPDSRGWIVNLRAGHAWDQSGVLFSRREEISASGDEHLAVRQQRRRVRAARRLE